MSRNLTSGPLRGPVKSTRSAAVLVPLVLVAASLASCFGPGAGTEEQGPHLLIAATPATQAVTQGGQGTAHVNITRTTSVTGPIALSFNGPAAQVFATTTVPAGTSSADVALAIPVGLATGSTSVTIRATATGAGDATQTISLNVGPAIGTLISVKVCSPFTLRWAASKSEGMPWVQRQITDNGFSLAMNSSRGMLAFTKQDASSDITTHLIADTPANLAALYTGSCQADSARVDVSGVVLNAAPLDPIYVSAARAVFVDLEAPPTFGVTVPFTLNNVRTGSTDFLAVWRASKNGAPLGGVLRSNVTVPFSENFSFDLSASNRLSFVGGGLALGNQLSTPTVVRSFLYTPNGTLGKLMESAPANSPTFPLYGLSPTLLPNGAIHVFEAMATGSADTRKITIDSRLVPSGMTGNLPPLLPFNSSCLPTTGSAARLGFTGTADPALNQVWNMKLTQGTTGSMRRVEMNFGAAYLIGGQAYNFFQDDWTSMNFNEPSWALQRGIAISATNTAKGSNLAGGATSWTRVDGRIVYESTHVGTVQCQ